MRQKVAIIGTGITGLTCAYVLHLFDPQLQILFIDAGPEPEFISKKTYLKGHFGATLGHSRDARQFTGTEGLSFQNPIHTTLLFKKSSIHSDGWCTLNESNLTAREKKWRQELIDRYKEHFTVIENPYNEMYTALNYGGMEAWSFLSSIDKNLNKFRIRSDHVYVAFERKEELHTDFESESAFNPRNSNPKHRVSFANIDILTTKSKNARIYNVYQTLLRIPGSAWRMQSLWKYFYHLLKKNQNISFKWNTPISSVKKLPNASTYIWTSGSGHTTPDIYTEHVRVQGIGGVWLTIPNPGFKVAFKISAPQPNGYINLPPDGEFLHISGGFGWVGERKFKESQKLLKTVKAHVIERLSVYLHIPKKKLEGCVSGYCLRPTTPTGMPDIKTLTYGGREHIMISGAGKAGSTESSLLALYIARSLNIAIEKKLQTYKKQSKDSYKVIEHGLQLLSRGLEPNL